MVGVIDKGYRFDEHLNLPFLDVETAVKENRKGAMRGQAHEP